MIAHTEWGAGRGTLQQLCRSLIRSKLDYGSFIYQSARMINSKILNPICHGGLRLVLGAFRRSPVESLYAKANEAPANIRSNKLATQYYANLKSCPNNPAAFHPRYRGLFEKREKAINPFGLRMKSMLQESEKSVKNILQDISPETPPWILEKPDVIFKLNELPKTKPHPSTYSEKSHHILMDYPEHLHVFMDGSKDHTRTACVAVLNETIYKKALPMESSIFTAEVCVIDLALNIIGKKFLIFSDSPSVLTSMCNKKFENPLIIKLLSRLDLMPCHNEIGIRWIPNHIRVKGNERAELAAKAALHLRPDNSCIPYIDLKPKINRLFFAKWQRRWNNNINN